MKGGATQGGAQRRGRGLYWLSLHTLDARAISMYGITLEGSQTLILQCRIKKSEKIQQKRKITYITERSHILVVLVHALFARGSALVDISTRPRSPLYSSSPFHPCPPLPYHQHTSPYRSPIRRPYQQGLADLGLYLHAQEDIRGDIQATPVL